MTHENVKCLFYNMITLLLAFSIEERWKQNQNSK